MIGTIQVCAELLLHMLKIENLLPPFMSALVFCHASFHLLCICLCCFFALSSLTLLLLPVCLIVLCLRFSESAQILWNRQYILTNGDRDMTRRTAEICTPDLVTYYYCRTKQ
jgi:hypothetical protein